MRPLNSVAFFIAVALGAVIVRADQTIGSLNTVGFSPSGGHAFLAQSFIVPTGETGLVSGALVLHNETGGDKTGTMSLFPFSDDGSTGTLGGLLGSHSFVLPAGGQQTITQLFDLPVIAGNKYALLVSWPDSFGQLGGYFNSNYYDSSTETAIFENSGGGAAVVFTGLDLAFQATFGPIPEPASLATIFLPIALLLHRR